MGVEAFTIPTINLSIHGSNKKNFNKLYMKAVGPLGLNQVYTYIVKLCNTYYMYSVNIVLNADLLTIY